LLGKQGQVRPLLSWDALLSELAFKADLLSAYKHSLSKTMPTVQWDELVRAAVPNYQNQKNASKVELKLKGHIAQILRTATQATGPMDGVKVAEFLAATGDHIVSLNFDNLLSQGCSLSKKSSPSPGKEFERFEKNGKTIWHPHGCIDKPESIKLGQRDYGFLPQEWSGKISKFKEFERAHKAESKDVMSDEVFGKMICALKAAPSNSERSLLGHLLLGPLLFYGVGLSQNEWGLWWLLNQRARNLARIPSEQRPPTVIIKQRQDPQVALWELGPVGISTIFVDDWDEGWEKLLQWLQKQK
jgi:hypothetical protein